MKIVSYNVSGLCSPHKRGRLWQEFCQYMADVVFIQETHFTEGSLPQMHQYQYNQWFHSASPIARARGLMKAFGGTCPLTSIVKQVDTEGRFVFVKGTLNGHLYTFASIYAPNTYMVDTKQEITLFGPSIGWKMGLKKF